MTRIERIILHLPLIAFVLRKSKQLHVPGTKGLTFYHVTRSFIQQVNTTGIGDAAAAVAFNFIMAIPAAVIFLCTLVPYLSVSQQFYKELSRMIKSFTPSADVQVFIMNFLNDFFNRPKTGLLSIGFIVAIYYSSNAVMGVMRIFDRSLTEKIPANFIKKRLRAIKLTCIIMMLIIGCILISVGQGIFFKFFMHNIGIEKVSVRAVIKLLRWVLVLILVLYSIGFIYKYAPSVKERWRVLSPGTILASALTIIVTWGFAFWAERFCNYNAVYGSIGTLLLTMLMVYINSYILLIGFEFNVVISKLNKEK